MGRDGDREELRWREAATERGYDGEATTERGYDGEATMERDHDEEAK